MHESAKVEAGSTEPTFTPVVARRPQLRRAPLAGRRALVLGGMLWVAAIGAIGAAAFTFEHLFTDSAIARPTDVWLPPDDEKWAEALAVPPTVAGTAAVVVSASAEPGEIALVLEELVELEGGGVPSPAAVTGGPEQRDTSSAADDGVDSAGPQPTPLATLPVPVVADPDVPVGTTTTPAAAATTSPLDGQGGGSSGPDEGPSGSASTPTSRPTTTTLPTVTSDSGSGSGSGGDGDNSGPGSGSESDGDNSGDNSGSNSGSNSGPGRGDGTRP